jgi:hypothetical protein
MLSTNNSKAFAANLTVTKLLQSQENKPVKVESERKCAANE